jgi:hypothetical protein
LLNGVSLAAGRSQRVITQDFWITPCHNAGMLISAPDTSAGQPTDRRKRSVINCEPRITPFGLTGRPPSPRKEVSGAPKHT